MARMLVGIVGAAALLAGCATQSPPPPAVVSTPARAAAPSTDTGVMPSPDQLWDVNRVTCEQWIGASDDDRAAVGMFYYGWMAGTHGIHELKPISIKPNLQKVLAYCGDHGNTTIVKAFVATFASHRSR
jgi:hypothetical protein